MKKLKYLLVVLCSICCLSLAFFGAASAEDGVIKIGVLMNLTGPWASIDGPAWNSIQLAVKNINDAGGLLGKKVKAICIDTKADEAETVSAVVRLCEEEKVNALIGYCDTHWVLTAAPIARDYGIPFVTAGATHPRIPERSGAWLACFGDNAQASVVAEYAYAQGLRSACIWIDTAVDFSVACCTYFIDAFKHLGGKVVYSDYYEVGWTDFSALVTRLKSREKEVDFTYNAAIPGNTGLITKQIREGGIKMPIISADGSDTPTLVEVAGKHAEGVIITSHMTLLSKDPLVVKYVEGYNKMFGKNPKTLLLALGYDATMLIAEAIKKINSNNRKELVPGFLSLRNCQVFTGKITYKAGSRVPDKRIHTESRRREIYARKTGVPKCIATKGTGQVSIPPLRMGCFQQPILYFSKRAQIFSNMEKKDPLLRIENVSKSFGGLCAVKNYTLNLPKGKIYGLIGHNGAGKNDHFDLITGVLKVSEGKISFKSRDITDWRPDQRAKIGINRNFQNLRYSKDLQSSRM